MQKLIIKKKLLMKLCEKGAKMEMEYNKIIMMNVFLFKF